MVINGPKILIVGSNSLIGEAFLDHLSLSGINAIGTTRRKASIGRSQIYLDLSENTKSFQYPESIDTAVICAGVTKIEECRRNSKLSYVINVKNTLELIKKLVTRGAFVIYLSSNQVFDGSIPYRMPEDPVSPVTEYGRQKAEVERKISQWGDSISIVRFTKVLGPKDPLFSQWSEALRNGESIRPFSDMFMAPVPLSCAVSVLKIIMDLRLSGITQVSGKQDIPYLEAACLGARLLGFDVGLVKPITLLESESYMEPIPANTTLNIDCLKHILGIVPPDVRWTIKWAFKSL